MEKAKKLLILGNFNYSDPNAINGQTQKTRELFNLLKNEEGLLIDTWDSEMVKKIPVIGFFKLIKKMFYNNDYIILPAQRSLFILLPLTLMFSYFKKGKVLYVVIGGWLPDFVSKYFLLKSCLKSVDSIMVETNQMKIRLNENGLQNTIIFPNFKLIEYQKKTIKKQTDYPLKGVFISRISEQKGVLLLLEALTELNTRSYKDKITIDYFGPIDSTVPQFLQEIKVIPNASYNGILNPKKIQEVLAKYDFFIFPTYYHGEGFPGVILDAIYANLPIIASDWKYNAEILENGKTGLIFRSKSVESIVNMLEKIINSPNMLIILEENMKVLQEKYNSKNALSIIINELNN